MGCPRCNAKAAFGVALLSLRCSKIRHSRGNWRHDAALGHTGAQLVEIVADVPCRVVFGEDPEPTLDDGYLPANTPPLMTMNPAPAEHDGQGVVILDAV